MVDENTSKPRPLDGKNRVVLPPNVMDTLALEPDDYVVFSVEKGEVKVKKVEWNISE